MNPSKAEVYFTQAWLDRVCTKGGHRLIVVKGWLLRSLVSDRILIISKITRLIVSKSFNYIILGGRGNKKLVLDRDMLFIKS